MPWWNPITWLNGALVSAQQLNEQVRDNLRHLKGLDGPAHIENAIDLTTIPPPGVPATGRTRIYSDLTNFNLVFAHNSARGVMPMTALKGAVSRSTNQIIPNNTMTTITFDVQEPNGQTWIIHSASFPDRLTTPTSGWYLVGAWVTYLSGATGLRMLGIVNNSSTPLARMQVTESDQTELIVSTMAFFGAGNFVNVVTRQTSGNPLNIASGARAWIIGPF